MSSNNTFPTLFLCLPTDLLLHVLLCYVVDFTHNIYHGPKNDPQERQQDVSPCGAGAERNAGYAVVHDLCILKRPSAS